MSNVTETVDLDFGLFFNGECHCTVDLRPARLADTYAAIAAVAVPDDLQNAASGRIAYQVAVDDAQVLAQISKLGSLDAVPSIQALAAEIDPEDMRALASGAERLKKKWQESKRSSRLTAAPNTCSSEPDSA